MGAGHIAGKFAQGLTWLEGAELVAIGSRAQGTADAFGDRFGVPHRHASYEALAADPDVDVVYVATPHPMHRANSLLCLEAGKAVLCEKPFAVNAGEAAEVVACGRERGLFLMEAMWSRFLPAYVELRRILAEGLIGEVRMVKADFGYRSWWYPEGRLLNPALAGGALLDVGCYTVSLASMVFGGPPDRVTGLAHIGETGVDEQAGVVLGYGGGALAVLTCAVRTATPFDAHVAGTEGFVRIHHPCWVPTRMALVPASGEEQPLEVSYEGNGFNYEAAEVMACLRAGRTESDVMPLDESVAIMETLDRIRAQWGLKYPME